MKSEFLIGAIILNASVLGCSGGAWITPEVQGPQGIAGQNGKSCTVIQSNGTATISCPNGSTATITNGVTGPQGDVGPQGFGSGIQATSLQTACNGVGGVQLITFTDPANTGIYNPTLDTVTSTTLVCNGQAGSQGEQGVAGQNGISSTVSVSAANLTECPNGGYDISITNGNTTSSPYALCDGAVGAQGNQGTTGATGASGSSNLSMVQFCSGYTTTYPNSFPEFGFCVDGNIYATYWDGSNAWTAEIEPGYYESTSTDAGCNFTVGSNCQITD